MHTDTSLPHYVADHPPTNVIIIANDHDYLPLLDSPNVRLLNLKSKNNELCLPVNTVTDRQMTGEEYLQFKILVGDKSDNIPSVFKRCGKKTAMKLVADPTKLQERLDKEGSVAKASCKEKPMA